MAGSSPATTSVGSFNHLIRPSEQREREGEAKRLGGVHVDHQFDPRRLLHRQVGRLLALEDATGVDTEYPIDLGEAGVIAHQAASLGKLALAVDRGNAMTQGQSGDL